MPPFIAVVIPTFRRAEKLGALLKTLAESTISLGIVVVDNADDPATACIVGKFTAFEIVRSLPSKSLGVGEALAFGHQEAFSRWGERITHIVNLDDDAEVAPTAFAVMIDAMEKEKAALACPMITGPDGKVGWFPGTLDLCAFSVLKKQGAPEEYLRVCGSSPRSIYYATGVCVIVSRAAYERFGPPAANYWIRGEDLEYSMRYANQDKGIFVPDARVKHLPPPAIEDPTQSLSERSKHLAMLQNVTYLTFHVPYARRIARHLPGNFYRYLKTYGIKGGLPMVKAFWRGSVGAAPAGMTPPL